MSDLDKAYSNLASLLKTNRPSWEENQGRLWLNCLKRVEHVQGVGKLYKRISKAPLSDIGDYLAELWYAIQFSELGFYIVIEPLNDGPDLKISKQGYDIFVEITCFRKIYPGPPEIALSEEIKLVKYGDWMRDTNKAYEKILGKFRQLKREEITSSIIAIWNYDGDLEEIEIEQAVNNIRSDGATRKISLPRSLKFVVFAPWDGKYLTFLISEEQTTIEEELVENISKQRIHAIQKQILTW